MSGTAAPVWSKTGKNESRVGEAKKTKDDQQWKQQAETATAARIEITVGEDENCAIPWRLATRRAKMNKSSKETMVERSITANA